jgi:hypothetical protein
MAFEHKDERLAPLSVFLRRWFRYMGFSVVLLAGALAAGISGYHWIAGLGWVDSLLNASMILGGMGPVAPLETRAAKLFAAFYALFSGLVFIILMGIVLAPLAHRMMHKFHLDEEDFSG